MILTAKHAKIAKSFYDLFLCVRVYRVLRGSENLNGVFAIILTAKYAKTAKACMACFSSFVPFALFAVHGIQRECPL